MSELRWVEVDDDCPLCSGRAEVLTTAGNGYFHDGDNVTCVSCALGGSIVAEEDETCWINWDDMTPEEADAAYDAAPADRLSDDQIDLLIEIVKSRVPRPSGGAK